MNKALIITSSALAEGSASNRIAGEFESHLRLAQPEIEVVRRDVGGDPIPHLTAATVAGIKATAQTEAEFKTRALSDVLIAELQEADIIVIGSPMYNFGISSTLKAWFDHVLRAGITFRYSENGPEGLLKGKRAVVIESRGGFYSEGPGAVMDSQEGHIRGMLGFMGIEDVTFIRAEKLAFGPDVAEASIATAVAELSSYAGRELALAA